MNLRTITGQLIAVALIAPAAGVFAAELSGQGGPYTGPDQAVMTTASNDEFTFVNRDSVDASNDAMPARPGCVKHCGAADPVWTVRHADALRQRP